MYNGPTRPKGGAEALEVRRQIAGRLLQEGRGIRVVARLVGASPLSVFHWKESLAGGGKGALIAKLHPGHPPRLTVEQKEDLKATLLLGPRAAGFSADLGTLARVAQVIENHFGVKYHPSHVWRILREMGWSPQEPERRARERDEQAVERWREEEWSRVQKKPATKGGVSS